MKRDYSNFDSYYEELLEDIYIQHMDENHLKNMAEIIDRWIAPLGVSNVLDVGAGFGDARKLFEAFGVSYTGITLAEKNVSGPVFAFDFNFISDNEECCDLVFSRHSLEHSPFPIITLMEWWRVSKKWLCLVLPNPDHYTYVGRNHMSVANAHQAAWWLRRAGWKLHRVFIRPSEYWFLCTKESRISHEGWASAPIENKLYEFERDLHKIRGEITNVREYFHVRGWDGIF